jgi:hypothetical protein
VDDLIEGFLRLMNHPSLTGPVNIGNPGEFTMLELAELVAAALLEFLAGAAGAGGVAAGGSMEKLGLRLGRLSLSWVPSGRGPSRGRCGGAAGGGDVVAGEGFLAAVELLRLAVELLEEGLEVGGGAEQVLQGLLLDGIHQGDEQVVGLVLVFDERVLLALGAEADAFAQGVHVVEVFLPLLVDGDEHHAALLLVEHSIGRLPVRIS